MKLVAGVTRRLNYWSFFFCWPLLGKIQASETVIKTDTHSPTIRVLRAFPQVSSFFKMMKSTIPESTVQMIKSINILFLKRFIQQVCKILTHLITPHSLL